MLTTLLIFVIGFFCSAAQAPPAKVVSKSQPKAVISRDQTEISKSIIDSILTKIDVRVVQEMERAWRAAGAGMGAEESVLLIFRMVDESIQARHQGRTNERRAFIFEWHPSAIAIVHTHPNSVDPRPSRTDQRVADRYGVPIFTLTLRGMYLYDPHAKRVTLIHDRLDWLEPSRWKAKGLWVLTNSKTQ